MQSAITDFTLSQPNLQTAPGFNPRQHFGFKWELWAADQLTALGYQVTMPPDYSAPYDLRIARPGHAPSLHIEVKAARCTWRRMRPGYYRRYQFDLSGGLNAGRYRIDFVYVLIALSESTGEIVPFIVPSYALGNRNQVQITSDPAAYKGKLLAPYRHAWGIIDDVYNIRRRLQMTAAGQLSIFDSEVKFQ